MPDMIDLTAEEDAALDRVWDEVGVALVRAQAQQRSVAEGTCKRGETAEECDEPSCDGDDCDQPLLENTPALAVPDERQTEGWSCGAACCAAVCRFLGVEPDTEAEAIRSLGSSPRDGTDPEHLIQVLQGAGLETTALSGMDLEQVEWFLGKGRPVIVCLQAWGSPEEMQSLQTGHYCVVCGLDADAVTVMDPARFTPGEEQGEYQGQASGQKVRVPRAVFLERWVDVDSEGNKYRNYGIAVKGKHAEPVDA